MSFWSVVFAAVLMVIAAPEARAQNLTAAPAAPPVPAASTDKPLEITADQTLEWRRTEKKFIAAGNAVAVQGDVSIRAAMLTADYREQGGKSMDIYRLSAETGVVISSQGNVVTGDHAVYEVDTGLATMTGQDLKMTGPDQVVTAHERFEYSTVESRLTAIGDARAVRQGDELRAAKMSAWFAKDAAGNVGGQNKLDRLAAEDSVVITTPDEVLTGDRGDYNAATEVATLTGHVKIMRGPNVIEGQKAEINLKTNISKMIGGSGGDGRVRGVFYPGSTQKPGGSSSGKSVGKTTIPPGRRSDRQAVIFAFFPEKGQYGPA